MVFSSLVFIFVFFVIYMVLYLFFAKSIRQKNRVLLVCSLFFYMWSGPVYVLLLMGMTGICWISGRVIEQAQGNRRKGTLLICCILMLGLLGYFKYTSFFLGTLQSFIGIPKELPQIVLPIGISFYTFQLLSYVVDVYRGEIHAQKSYGLLLLYASLFHQCIVGPIVRYQDVHRELLHRNMSLNTLAEGIERFSCGLAKKAVLANGCARLADSLLPSGAEAIRQAPAAALWLGMLCYMLQIYLDFSAYSDMAIGMGQMIGLHYKENFRYPYAATSVTEFWRRWHISLGSFFRDYVYIPLGGNREGTFKQVRNLFIVWALTGLWHGASWNYVAWGLYFFCLLLLEKFCLQTHLNAIPKVFSHIYLLFVVYMGWVLFRFESMGEILAVFRGMLCLNGNAAGNLQTTLQLKNELFFLIVSVAAVTPLVKRALEAMKRWSRKRYVCTCLYAAAQSICPVVLLVCSVMSLVGDSYNPFLYFQF